MIFACKITNYASKLATYKYVYAILHIKSCKRPFYAGFQKFLIEMMLLHLNVFCIL